MHDIHSRFFCSSLAMCNEGGHFTRYYGLLVDSYTSSSSPSCTVPLHCAPAQMNERKGREEAHAQLLKRKRHVCKDGKRKKKKLQTKSEYKRDDTQFTWQRSIGIRLKVRGHKYCRKLFRRRTPPASNESTIYVHSHILCVFHYPSACDSYVPMALCSVVRIVRIYRMCVCVSIIASYRHGARCTYNVDCA